MAEYRLYCSDGRGKVWVDDEIVAENDEEAIAIAKGIDNIAQCELWAGDRLVASIKPESPA